jgi:hypothetical protein
LLDQIVFVNTPKFFVLKVMGAAGYTWNLSYSGGRNRRVAVQGQLGQKVINTLSQKRAGRGGTFL